MSKIELLSAAQAISGGETQALLLPMTPETLLLPMTPAINGRETRPGE